MARATGMVRPSDETGRVVIPKEIRSQLGWSKTEQIEILTTEDGVLLRKFTPGCTVCGRFDNLKLFLGRQYCSSCRSEIGGL